MRREDRKRESELRESSFSLVHEDELHQPFPEEDAARHETDEKVRPWPVHRWVQDPRPELLKHHLSPSLLSVSGGLYPGSSGLDVSGTRQRTLAPRTRTGPRGAGWNRANRMRLSCVRSSCRSGPRLC